MSRAYWGNYAGPGPSRYRVYIEYRTGKQEETRAAVQRKISLHVEGGSDFQGSLIDTSWAGRVTLYGEGWYADTGWQDVGYVNYGATHSSACNASYTSYSAGYQNSSVSATYTPDVPTWAPKAPSGISVSRRSNNQNVVSWTRNVTAARPYASQVIERSTDGGSYVQIAALSATATSYTDNSTQANHRYSYRVAAFNSAGTSGYVTSGWAYNTPAAPSACGNTRNSDTKNTVTWTRGSSDTGLYSGHRVERQVDGGSWTRIATVGPSVTSYADTTTSANHSYAYRVQSYNPAGDSGYKASGTTYNTPSAPGKPTMSRMSDTAVKGTFANNANTATSLEVERSTDRSTWTALPAIAGKVSTFADNPGGGTFYYRIRNARPGLASEWAYSDGIVTICAPNAPTVTSPASSAVVPKAQESITIEWTHNPIDGSAQTAAEVRWSSDGGATWQSAGVATARSYTLANSFAVNDTVTLQVRTRGSHADFGPWSASRMFFVYQVPTVTVEQPADGFTASNMPIHVEVAYSDPSGTLAQATMTVLQDDAVVYARDVTNALEFDIQASEWLPGTGAVYEMRVEARSTSTLQAQASRTFAVEFEPPRLTVVDAVPDPDTGHVTVTVRAVDDGGEDVETCSLYRVSENGTVLLADNLSDGDWIVDENAPLNVEYRYMTASFAASGAVSQGTYPGLVKSRHMFFYWPGGIVRAWFDVDAPPSDTLSLSPQSELVDIEGSEHPVAIMVDRTSESRSAAFAVYGREELAKIRDMVAAHETVVYKALHGDVVRVDVTDVSVDTTYAAEGFYRISLDMRRVAGEPL